MSILDYTKPHYRLRFSNLISTGMHYKGCDVRVKPTSTQLNNQRRGPSQLEANTTMVLTLYGNVHSTCTARVRTVLEELSLAHEFVEVDLAGECLLKHVHRVPELRRGARREMCSGEGGVMRAHGADLDAAADRLDVDVCGPVD